MSKKATKRARIKPTKKAKPARRTPRSQSLPGMSRVRDRVLDNLCEGIGDEREKINEARGEEQKLIASSLQRMQKAGLTVYKHARIELARVPGAEKLRVRVVKEGGDAGVEDLEPPETAETDAEAREEAAVETADAAF